MIFFLLSGFVIFHSTDLNADKSFGSYLRRRVRRIFPIFLLALLVSWLFRGDSSAWSGRDLAGNLFMLQDFSWAKPGVWFDTFCGNLPLWSLSYEWWFYLLFFPVYRWCPERFQLGATALVSAVGLISYQLFPNQASLFLQYFVVWWVGAELAKMRLRGSALNLAACYKCLAVLVGFATALALPVLVAKRSGAVLVFGQHPVLELRHFTAAAAGLVVALVWRRLRWGGFAWIFRWFGPAAGISYAIYVLHYPMVIHASYLAGRLPRSVELTIYLAVFVFVAWFAEGPFQRWFNRMIR